MVALVAGAATAQAQNEDPTLRRPPAGQSQDRGGNAGGQERNRGQDAQRPDADQGSRRNQQGQAEDQQPPRRNQQGQVEDQQPRRNQQGQAEDQPPRRNQQGQAEDQQPRRNQQGQAEDQQPRRNQQGQAEDQQPRRNQQGQAEDQQPRRNQQGQAEDQQRRNQQGERDQADTTNRDRNRDQADRGGDRTNVRVKSSVNIVTKLDAPRREKVVVSFRERAKPLPRADFRIDVGVNVPRSVTLNPIPDVIIRDVPEYRSYRYVIVENEILIIEPDTYRIVEIIPEDEAGGGGRRNASLVIDRAKFSVIKRDLRPRARVVERQITLREGDDVPEDIELEAVPDTIVREVPQLRTYRYVYLQNEVVIVDPDSRRVVEVIQ